MFKTIKFVADLVRQNNNYQSALGDIILKLKKQDNTFLVSSIDEVDYIICMIDKLQKENADLKQELDLIYDDMDILINKIQHTGKEDAQCADAQMKIIFNYIDRFQKDMTELLNKRKTQ